MVAIERTDLAILALAALDRDRTQVNAPPSVSDLIKALDYAENRLSQQMTLATTLQELREDGWVEAEATDQGELTFRLTPSGTERATDVRERLANTTIEVADGQRRERTLAEAAAELDRSIPQVAANLIDGTYHPHDEVEERIVGRKNEYERCYDVIDTASESGRGHALLVTGPGGIGKTALIEDVLSAARGAGHTVVRARCRGVDSAPYHPVYDALSALDTELSSVGGGLATDDPELFKNQQRSLFYDFTRALVPADDDPLRILFLDDLHLADSGTMAYLGYLADRLRDHRLVLVMSCRPAELSADESFEDAFAETNDHVTSLRLGPLDRTATREVLEQAVGRRGAPDSLVDVVYERTGGNPLFVEETVTALIDANRLDPTYEWYPTDGSPFEVPTAIREAITDQLDALDEPGRTVLRWAALIGERVPIPVLERVVDLPTVQVETLVDTLVEAAIFEHADDGAAIAFRSEVVHEAILSTVTGDRARHATIATAFEAEYAPVDDDRATDATDGDWSVSTASHHERAGNTADAIEWYCRAGERAIDVYAHDAGVDHYHRALTLARDSGDDETVLTITERLARCYLVTAAFDLAERHIEFARERATDVSRRQRLAALATTLAIETSDYDAAVEYATEGLAIDSSPSREYCSLLLGRADAEDNLGAFDQAVETAKTAHEIAVDLDADDLVVEAQYLLGEIATKQDRFDAARTFLERALARAEGMCLNRHVAKIHLVLGIIAMKQAERETMRTHQKQALERFEETNDPHGAALARCNIAVLDRQEGNYDDARRKFERAIETFDALGDQHAVARQQGNLGSLAISEGEYETAWECYERALTLFEAIGERREIALAEAGLGKIALKWEDYETAEEHLRSARDAFVEMDVRRGGANSTLALGIVAVETGDYDAAETLLDEALSTFESIGDKTSATGAHLALALLETRTDSPERGLDRWPAIDENFETIDPGYSVEPFERLIRACRDADDPAAAIEWCDRGLARLDADDVDGLDRLRDALGSHRADLEAEQS